MNTEEYIQSGNLEACILGALTAAEANEVAVVAARYPKVAQEMSAIESVIQQLTVRIAMCPPAGTRDKIWNAWRMAGYPSSLS